MKLAIQSNIWSTDRHQTNLANVLEEIARAGYAGAEIGAHKLDLNDPDALRGLLTNHKLQVSGLHVHAELHNSNAMLERYTFTQKVAAFAAQVHAPYVLVSSRPQEGKTVKDFQHEAEALNQLGDICRQQKVKLLYHNHNWELTHNAAEYRHMVSHSDPALVGLAVDVGWVTRAGFRAPEFIREFGERIEYFHIKDTLPNEQWTEVGKGIVDFKGIFALLKEFKNDYWLTVERDETLAKAFESAQEARQALKTFGI